MQMLWEDTEGAASLVGASGKACQGSGLCAVVCRPGRGRRGETWGVNTPRESGVEPDTCKQLKKFCRSG